MRKKSNGKRNRYWKARSIERNYVLAQAKAERLNDAADKELDDYCLRNGIHRSRTGDSFYFRVGSVNYRVSNHSEEYSNQCSRNGSGRRTRRLYHGSKDRHVSIIASKEKLPEIFERLNRKET